MSTELLLFNIGNLYFKEKLYRFMDILINNQSTSRMECIILIIISYMQMISGFFAKQIEVFNDDSTSDSVLYFIEKIIRYSDILIDKYSGFKISIILILISLIIFIIIFLFELSKINLNSSYSYKKLFINYYIKCFNYIGFNIILDLVFSNFCFGENETNPFFKGVSCKIKDNIQIIIFSVILLIISIITMFFIQFFYFDSQFLSNSFYSKISCNYEIYTTLNSIFYSIFLIEAKYLSKEVFLIYNLIISIMFFKFYIEHYLFYDNLINLIAGLFHILYLNFTLKIIYFMIELLI